MSLFGFHKKKKVSKNNIKLDIPIPKYDGGKNSDKDLKKVINANIKEKTEFDIKKANREIEYVDEVLSKDLDLNSKEINTALSHKQTKNSEEELELPEMPEDPNNSGIHPEIKKKLEQHHEVIHINLPDEEVVKRSFIDEPMLETLIKKHPKKEEAITNTVHKQVDKLDIELPKKIGQNELPNFSDEKSEIQKTRKLVEDFKKKRTFKENVFVKSKLYREILHSNIIIKEDIKVCGNKLNNITKSINAQSNKGESLRQELESIQDGLLTIEDKLFDNNPLMR